MEDRTATWELPRDLTAGAAARRHVADLLSPPAPDSLREACELVASELAINAVRHGQPPAHLTLSREGGRVRVEVTSRAGTTRPVVSAPDEGSAHGRGLLIVAGLAEHLGWEESDGWITVRAELTA